MRLVIVESPNKARKIASILKDLFPDDAFKVEASYGHVVDLPKKELGIKTAESFSTTMTITNYPVYNKLLDSAKASDEILLATDPDREGEAIAKYLALLFSDRVPNTPVHRTRIYEITHRGVKEAFDSSDDIDGLLCEAQLARRLLDRLVGYTLSPALWGLLNSGVSAGRVQSYALSLLVDRERERRKFENKLVYAFRVRFPDLDNLELVSKYFSKKRFQMASAAAKDVTEKDRPELVFLEKEATISPKPPYTTSSILQEAGYLIGTSPSECMSLLQSLFDSGYITYHRTDSIRLSPTFVEATRDYIRRVSGDMYLSQLPVLYKHSVSKESQGAHEAIRPTNPNDTPSKLTGVSPKAKDLYRLIWARAVATQAEPARVQKQCIALKARGKHKKKAIVTENILAKKEGMKVIFDGWTRFTLGLFLPVGFNNPISPIETCQPVNKELFKLSKRTEPKERYTESSLIDKLEKSGVGRPSTYASIVSSILKNKYAFLGSGGRLIVTRRGELIVWCLEKFPDIKNRLLSSTFTASMEDTLDRIASGKDSVESAYTVLSKLWSWLDPVVKSMQSTEGITNVTDGKLKLKVVMPRKGEPFLTSVGSSKKQMFGMDFSSSDEPCIFHPKPLPSLKCALCKKATLVLEQSTHGIFARCSSCLAIDKKARI